MLKLREQVRSFGGSVRFFEYESGVTSCPMRFSVYVPDHAEGKKLPVLYWLSGLTCTDENFMQKAGAQRLLASGQIILVAPDTSPRGLELPGENENWWFGTGAGFYVDATEEPWSRHYKMASWIRDELPEVVASELPVDPDRQSIFGHSMGGHGALTLALKNPGKYRSVSAFSPICAPTRCAWGQYAFSRYLGQDKSLWAEYDTVALLEKGPANMPLLVDQGSEDSFLKDGQLQTPLLGQALKGASAGSTLRMQEGYDHSYYFIATFLEDHIRFHSGYLRKDL